MKVAIVHDWLTGMRGGEKCLEAFLRMYPTADVFTLVHIPRTTSQEIDKRVKETSFLNKLPGVRRWYRLALPLYPRAIRAFDLSSYDLVISLSHAGAKNVRVGPRTQHVCYCFTPMRYIWDQGAAYFGRALPFLWPLIKRLRAWDKAGAEGVHHFVVISRFVAARIRKFYGREAAVIYPPTDVNEVRTRQLTPEDEALLELAGEGAFLCAGALVPYKRVDLAVQACSKLGVKLWVVGAGPELERLKKLSGPEVTFFGRVSDAVLAKLYERARALIFPGVEDFGLVPIECMAMGTPIIGLGAGALRETVQGLYPATDVPTTILGAQGVFVPKKLAGTVDGLTNAIAFFLSVQQKFSRDTIRHRATLFSYDVFLSSWDRYCLERGIPRPHFTEVSTRADDLLGVGERSYA